MERLIVTIDGPAGAGKSTVAKQLARRLGYRLLDTGAIYRAVALTAQGKWSDAAACAAVEHDQTLREIRERDQRDASRDVAPMKPAPDAVLVDSSTQTIDEVVESMARIVETRARDGK